MKNAQKVWPTLAGVAALAAAMVAAALPASAATYTDSLAIPARLQWNGNYGYCGEVSFISAGLYYGQYVSQYDARAIASPNVAQNLESSQLLVGVNDAAAASRMRLAYARPTGAALTSAPAFLAWVKGNVVSGAPVIIGVYANANKFYGSRNLNYGDPEYDHIVTVTGWTSSRTPTTPATYYSDDRITLEDHGVWTGTANGLPPYFFQYTLGSFQQTRRGANASTAAVYSLKNGGNYGIAITGVMDTDKKTVPVRLSTSQNFESPAIRDGRNNRPAASQITLTITVSGLTPGVPYNLYRYRTVSNIPTASFNANAAKAAQKWVIQISSGSTYVQTLTIQSSETAAFRAVPASAP